MASDVKVAVARLARLSSASSRASVARPGFFRLAGTVGEVAAEMSDMVGGGEEGEQRRSDSGEEEDFLSELKEALSAVATSSPVGMAAVCR